ncbi:receptor like protein 21-like isoform X11 [Juglans microcarpa x Juglans regia]|uniref:receptor like protein 21-like isoform X11 n=1 Tax=Juglans microcarpa x Juglans regia TaxID=2249226 RepID=UPI001B7DC6A0|nr:receptor like protein 21-like isoform X11 [Juglans microcarpa x Juglans regia]
MNMGVLQYYFSMKALLWVLVVFVQTREYMGCLEEERAGLLHLKSFLIISIPSFRAYNSDYDRLPSWVDHEKSDCCNWERVTCNSTTGHLIELSLENLMQDPRYNYYDYDYYYYYEMERFREEHRWLLNVSLLEPFKELRSLDLSCNAIDGCIPDEGFEKLSTLRNLEILNLGRNFFDDNSILQSLGAITSLKTLNLTENKLEGYFPAQELVTLRDLNTLDISWNRYNGTLPNQGFERLAVLRNLETLILDWNWFGYMSTIPSLSNLTSLMTLSLSWNNIRFDEGVNVEGGSFKRLAVLRNLKTLNLEWNHFDDSIIPSLSGLTSLTTLSLAGNKIQGGEGSKMLSRLENLEKLDLSVNFLKDTNFFQSIATIKSLKNLNLHWNELGRSFGTKGWEILSRLENLEILDLSHNYLNDTSFLQSIAAIKSLKNLNLAWNDLGGSFPTKGWKMLSRLENLEILDLNKNFLNDTSFLQSIAAVKSLKTLNLQYNELTGSFPTKELANLSNLDVLILGVNHFGGRLPMQGRVPRGLTTGCLSLSILNLAHNSFNGAIFIGTNQENLQMNDNQFTSITPVHNSTVYLSYLDISNNKISDTIPRWLGNTSYLRTLVMADNSFYGSIPCELSMTGTLDLSHNLFTGSLPFCLNLPKLEHLYLQGNKFTGSIPKVLFNSSSLLTLDIGDNNFTGSISVEIKQLQSLKVLLLSSNHFTGIIPNQLCLLRMISIMDLSKNAFSGTIPQCLHDIYFGKTAAPSVDYFSGKVDHIGWGIEPTYTYKGFSDWDSNAYRYLKYVDVEVEIEFVTKYRHSSYKGSILGYMSGLDLSCNKLTGSIPSELGQISSLHALNLSYNQLTSTIPESFSKLTPLESLDLSHNSLSGEIPSTLIDLTFLEVFSVANNNLSGKVPDMKAQFATFEKSSYEGNLFLCGPPLDKSCGEVDVSYPTQPQSSNASDKKWYEVDPVVFHTSFLVTYIIFFFSVISLVYINPYWLQRCSNLIEDLIFDGYYFFIWKLKNFLCM